MKTLLLSASIALAIALGFAALPNAAFAQASEVRYIVDNTPITSYDIQRRAAFLQLQRRGGGQQAAAQELIEQTLRRNEIRRLNINISEEDVAQAYQRFASSNNMSTAQMDQVMSQTGVTKQHFLEFIRSQMGWSQALGARARHDQGSRVSEQDAVQRMLQQGGEKPVATEYMLQQVIFVVPAAERGARLATRKREAEAMRARFQGCDSTREFAKGLMDVTVRDLGRVLEPQLPPEWADPIKSISAGNATVVRETDRGVEFIGICSAREVSDDTVAQAVFEAENLGNSEDSDALSKKYTAELRERAQIVQR
ncbi:peptidylprolyl isomerase [Aliihoeflea sp. 40Bstr573]|uniref:SurA N-terminal domain-containing protein n=1 Tax=Aliihoeflea sp. 40Bstr573 TaxID=2696467 RepID=UPI002095D45A|nr:peptidylprolyl isomerase [Aliihoeflea sp. 40Bstr573]MCO6387849.1 peptidylprolyl isomerase [Aliihoeflea sp. 40Bstr573]